MLEKMTPNSKFRSQNPSSDKGGGLPAEFREAGIDENQLRSLSEYDTVIIVDDSGSMSYGNRWDEVSGRVPTHIPTEPVQPHSRCSSLSRRHVEHSRYSHPSPPNTTRTGSTSTSSTTAGSLGGLVLFSSHTSAK